MYDSRDRERELCWITELTAKRPNLCEVPGSTISQVLASTFSRPGCIVGLRAAILHASECRVRRRPLPLQRARPHRGAGRDCDPCFVAWKGGPAARRCGRAVTLGNVDAPRAVGGAASRQLH